jgi:hypothetical protein
MKGQLQVTQIKIFPPQPSDPARLLCYASIVLCGCFEVAGIRLVQRSLRERVRVLFPASPASLQADSTKSARRGAIARPTDPVTRSMIEWAVLRTYRDWLDTYAPFGGHTDTLLKEQTP